MANNKSLKMQKSWLPEVIEFGGESWYGEVYQVNRSEWGWCIAVDAGDRLIVRGGQFFETSEGAARSLKACVMVELAALQMRLNRSLLLA